MLEHIILSNCWSEFSSNLVESCVDTWVICLLSWFPLSSVTLSGHLAFITISLVSVSRL